MTSSYFTRLTPNTNLWQKPSGPIGKCAASTDLYESRNCFGWEEWLLDDFHSGEDLCIGFLQAFNGKKKSMTHVDVIHLYTRVCNGVDVKLFYVGCIQGVKILSKENRGASHEVKVKRLEDLKNIGINNFPIDDPMWNNCFNVQFERKNVNLLRDNEKCSIKLWRGQYRFALYSTINHSNFLSEIQNYK